MACEDFSRFVRQAATGVLVGLVVWTAALVVLSVVPLNGGERLGYYTPTGLLTVQAHDGEGSLTFSRQLLPR